MKNYWLDRRYPLATAVRDYRKTKDALNMQLLERMFHEMALKILSTLPASSRKGKLLDVMEAAAWEHIDRFDLRRKAQAVIYFTNVMKSVLPPQQTVAEQRRIQSLRRTAILRALGPRTAVRRKTP